MNICILKESLAIGGTERSAANISRILEKDHNVYVALWNGQDVQYACGGELVDFSLPPRSGLAGKAISTFQRYRKVRQFVRKHKIDVLYMFLGIGGVLNRIRFPGTVKLISARDFGGMRDRHEEYKAALQKSDAMICNSEYIRRFYLSQHPDDEKKVFSVYNVIDIPAITAQAQEETEPEYLDFLKRHNCNIVSTGRFCMEKGFEYLIEAFSLAREKVPDLGLVLVGDGNLRDSYVSAIQEAGLKDHVYFTGFQKNPYPYMKQCDLYVLSSVSEGFPNVLAEAMALGLPVIAANCFSGPAEILRKDQNYDAVTDQYAQCDYGILTPAILKYKNQAVTEMAEAIVYLSTDREKMAEYGRLSLIRAADFSAEAAKNKLEEIFRKCSAGA